MYDVGDVVVHPRYGAGVVTKFRTVQYTGSERQYFCIELTEGRGDVMIPIERVKTVGLRDPIRDTSLIQEVMDVFPDTLVDDARIRQLGIEEKIRSGNVQILLQALRDLCWRETITNLSPTDKKLKESAIAKLLQELALNQSLVIATVKLSIQAIIQQAMEKHLATMQNPV